MRRSRSLPPPSRSSSSRPDQKHRLSRRHSPEDRTSCSTRWLRHRHPCVRASCHSHCPTHSSTPCSSRRSRETARTAVRCRTSSGSQHCCMGPRSRPPPRRTRPVRRRVHLVRRRVRLIRRRVHRVRHRVHRVRRRADSVRRRTRRPCSRDRTRRRFRRRHPSRQHGDHNRHCFQRRDRRSRRTPFRPRRTRSCMCRPQCRCRWNRSRWDRSRPRSSMDRSSSARGCRRSCRPP